MSNASWGKAFQKAQSITFLYKILEAKYNNFVIFCYLNNTVQKYKAKLKYPNCMQVVAYVCCAFLFKSYITNSFSLCLHLSLSVTHTHTP